MQSRLLLRAFAAVLALWVAPAVWAYVVQTDESGVYVIKWHSSPVEMEVKLPSTANLIDGNSQRSAVMAAAEVWNAQLGTVRISAQASVPGAYAVGNEKNEIVMDSTVDGEAFPSGALAITVSYTRGNDMDESDLVFNTAYTWNSYRGALRRGVEDIRRVAVHELGHVLGLDHPDEQGQYVTAIMNSHVSAIETLQPDDIEGVRVLYGAPGVVPLNDAFASASLVTLTNGYAELFGSNIGATREAGESGHAGSTSVHSVWWVWTAPDTGTLTVTTLGSNFDTVLAAYTGSNLAALTIVAANDDEELPEQNSTPQRKRTSKITADVVKGTTYRFAVDGWGRPDLVETGFTGAITLNVQFTAFQAPAFISGPGSRSVNDGEVVTFMAWATGQPTPTYRWQRRPSSGDWADLADGGGYVGAGSDTLRVTTSLGMNGDQYRCVATNRAGSATSAAANLQVIPVPPPVIRTHPTAQSAGTGDMVVLSVVADGAAIYQWYRDGAAVPGATSATLLFESAKTTDTGDYHVVVTNRGGSVSSATVSVAVRALPVVTNAGALRQVVAAGQAATFSVDATGSGTLGYQWYHDGREIPGATSPSYTQTISVASDGGAYWVAVTDTQGTRHGAPFFVLVSHTTTNVVGWGADYSGQLTLPTGLTNATSLSAGWSSGLALKQDGNVVAWGYVWHSQWTGAGPSNVVAVSTGRLSSLALKADGTVYATGDAENVPPGLKNVAAIACGASFALALKTDGTVVSWAGLTTPEDLRDVVAVAAGAYHAIALKRDGSVRAWGSYGSGGSVTPPATLGGVIAIAAGMSHTLAVKSDGTVVAWGQGESTNVPTNLRNVVAVSAGSYHSLALKADGTVAGWGENIYGQSVVPSGLKSVFAIAAGGHSSFVIRDVRADEPPLITTEPESTAVYEGGTLTLDARATAGTTLNYQWQRNGTALPSGTGATMALYNIEPADAGLYAVTVTSGGQSVVSPAAIVGLSTMRKVSGAGSEVGTDVRHPNGNTFDQILATGAAEAITCDSWSNQITRTSFIDLDGDIVQVEFSGPGTLSLVLDGFSGPAAPANYHQPDVQYVKGHAGIVIVGADERTNVSVFSVGRATAFDPTGVYDITKSISATNDPAKNGSPLFQGHAATNYDGIADIAFIAILSTNGKFGGVRTANTSYFASRGYTGLYAPGVEFTGPVYVGDVSAFDSAKPVIVLGSASDVRITGGDLLQNNRQPVQVSGITQLRFADGSDSHGNLLPAQTNQALLQQNGIDVTTQIVVSP